MYQTVTHSSIGQKSKIGIIWLRLRHGSVVIRLLDILTGLSAVAKLIKMQSSHTIYHAPTCDLQPHYGNGVFGNVYLLAIDNTIRGKHCRRPIAVMGVVDHLGSCQRRKQMIPTLIHHHFCDYVTLQKVGLQLQSHI